MSSARMTSLDIPMGIYRHYRGPLYQVIGLAHDSNADRLGVSVELVEHGGGWSREVKTLGVRIVVVYMPLQLDGAHLGPRMSVRTLEDFAALVCAGGFADRCSYWGQLPSQQCRDQGHATSRFSYLGPVLTADILGIEPAEDPEVTDD